MRALGAANPGGKERGMVEVPPSMVLGAETAYERERPENVIMLPEAKVWVSMMMLEATEAVKRWLPMVRINEWVMADVRVLEGIIGLAPMIVGVTAAELSRLAVTDDD